jgi:hypothetical protein
MVNHSDRFYLIPPYSVANIFGNLLNGVDPRFKILIRVGTIAVIWSIWLCKNDKVCNDKKSSLMQVMYRCTAVFRLWSLFQRLVSTRMENTVKEFITQHGWLHNRSITASME